MRTDCCGGAPRGERHFLPNSRLGSISTKAASVCFRWFLSTRGTLLDGAAPPSVPGQKTVLVRAAGNFPCVGTCPPSRLQNVSRARDHDAGERTQKWSGPGDAPEPTFGHQHYHRKISQESCGRITRSREWTCIGGNWSGDRGKGPPSCGYRSRTGGMHCLIAPPPVGEPTGSEKSK